MGIAGARQVRVFRDRLSAIALLLALLLLTLASDRLHNHSGVDEAFIAGASRGPSLSRHASLPQSRRPVVCVACLHHRTFGLYATADLTEGPVVILAEPPAAPAHVPPPAPMARPAGLRAPPLA